MARNLRIPLMLGTALSLTLVTAPAAAAQESSRDAAAAIARANAALAAAVGANDADAVAASYTPDGMLMAPNAPASTGREAIREHFAAMMEAIGTLALTTDDLVVFDGMAHEVGRYVIEGDDGSHMDHGKYIVIWKRTDEGWKLHRDIFNSDMAPPTGG